MRSQSRPNLNRSPRRRRPENVCMLSSLITVATEVHLHRSIRFARFPASERGRKQPPQQLPVLRQRVFQEGLFFTLRRALVM